MPFQKQRKNSVLNIFPKRKTTHSLNDFCKFVFKKCMHKKTILLKCYLKTFLNSILVE